MHIYIDTEFTDFVDMQLISLGAVTEDGREFYAEVSDYDKQASSAFVKEHVEPLLKKQLQVPSVQVGAKFSQWISDLGDPCALVVEYIPGDWQLTIETMGNTIPTNLNPEPVFTSNELMHRAVMYALTIGCKSDTLVDLVLQTYQIKYLDYFFLKKAPRHHALEDARAMKFAWEQSMQKLKDFKPRGSDVFALK